MLPLSDIAVVSVEQAVAGPFATRQLADLGARVIKVERPIEGDFARGYDSTVNGMSSHFVWLNRSKRSVTLDLKSEEGRVVFAKLLDRSDVLVSNLAPGAMDRLGFSMLEVRQAFPKIITCEISGYGMTGPYRDRKAYDLLIQAETGLLSVTGDPAWPAKVGISVADIAAGMYAYSGILAAIIKRGRTGEGSAISVSLFDALGEWMSFPGYFAKYSGKQPERTGTRHATISPYGDFKTGDGATLYIAVQNEREWDRFCAHVLGAPELSNDPRFCTNGLRVQQKHALYEIIESVFGGMTKTDAVSKLHAAAIAYADVNDVLGFMQHPQLAARNRFREVDSPVGTLSALIPPTDIEGVEPVMKPVPDLGEHTENTLLDLGYRPDDIERLRKQGVI